MPIMPVSLDDALPSSRTGCGDQGPAGWACHTHQVGSRLRGRRAFPLSAAAAAEPLAQGHPQGSFCIQVGAWHPGSAAGCCNWIQV